MVEIHRYGGKYFGGNCVNKFYETIRAIFQINKMISTEQCKLSIKVKRDAEKMTKPIWPSSFRGEDFFNISQSETRIALGGHICWRNETK
jgi:hypothetical protein